MKKVIVISMLLLWSTTQMFSQTVNGEILSDSNNVTIVKLWGTSEERGFAYGYLLGDKMFELFEGTIIPFWGDDWPAIKEMIAAGISFHIDSIYWNEAQAMMDGATAAGFNNSGYNSLDVMAGNCWHDLHAWGFGKDIKGFHCSTLMNWGEATMGTDLEGCSVISRHADDIPYPAVINNAVVVIHIPSEEGLQPWLLIGYAGDMAPYSGISSSGLSIFSTVLDDQTWNYSTQAGYEPFKFTFRKALESVDYNQDGVNNMLDIRDAISSNLMGYSWGWNFAALAPSTALNDSLIALVAEVAPEVPYITFRDNSYNDTLPGDNLFAANSQIQRKNFRHYCWRYFGIVNHIGEGTGVGAQENWDLMKNYTNLGNNNLQFMQYIPEWGQLNLSVHQNGQGAYLHNPISYDVNEFFQWDVPIANFIVDTANIVQGDTICFTDLSENEPTEWAWQFEGGTPVSSSEQNPTIIYNIPGIYDVTLIVSNNYGSDTLTISNYINVDTETGTEIPNNIPFIIYPNPVKDILTISHDENITSIEILNISGQIIKHQDFDEKQVCLAIGNLPDVLYFLLIRVGNDKVIHKIVVMK